MCGAELKEHSGFWGPGHSLQCEAGDVQRNVMAHVGIDRNTATAADSIFYTLEAMVPSGREVDLYGWIEADDARLTDLETLLQKEDYCISVDIIALAATAISICSLVMRLKVKTEHNPWKNGSSGAAT